MEKKKKFWIQKNVFVHFIMTTIKRTTESLMRHYEMENIM